jgi:hypothetical protein
VTAILVEPGVIVLGGTGSPTDLVAGAPLAPGVVDALGTLREAGHEVALLVDSGAAAAARRSLKAWGLDLPTVTDPSERSGGGWLVTADPRRCERRLPGLRTILVGPRRPPGPRPTAHCDVQARDLAAAVIEILAREAMP